jgi:hypothetical protein
MMTAGLMSSNLYGTSGECLEEGVCNTNEKENI